MNRGAKSIQGTGCGGVRVLTRAGAPTRPRGRGDGARGDDVSERRRGSYRLLDTFDTKFAFIAIQLRNGSAWGGFHHRVALDTGIVDFRARVTCLAVDPVLRRAWIGGVITSNDSTDPAFDTAVHQPGHDIWFRVLDNGYGDDPADRSTFVGFEGAIPSSASYCEQRIWPDGNARTWSVSVGDIAIHP